MFVIDSSDHDRITECHDEIHRLFQDEELKNSSLLVFANKQDLSTAMSISEVKSHLKLDLINVPWRKLVLYGMGNFQERKILKLCPSSKNCNLVLSYYCSYAVKNFLRDYLR